MSSPKASNRPSGARRTTRACDRCSRLRIRCDGQQPCHVCQEWGSECEYQRIAKRRGPKPRRPDMLRLGGSRNPLPVDHDTHNEHPSITINPPQQYHSNENSTVVEQAQQPFSPEASGQSACDSAEGNEPARSMSNTLRSPPALPVASGSELRPHSVSVAQPRRKYHCLEPVMPLLQGVLDLDTATRLLDTYFLEPNVSLFTSASPFVLTPIIRQHSLLRDQHVRPTSAALTLTMLWVCARHAQLPLLLLPRRRDAICERLYELSTTYVSSPEDSSDVDYLLALTLLTIMRSASDRKGDCLNSWHRIMDLAMTMGLHCMDEDNLASADLSACHGIHSQDHASTGFRELEHQEEKRRLVWLLFTLDRHWSLSFNSLPLLPEFDRGVYVPLPDDVWSAQDLTVADMLRNRSFGPVTRITGLDYFQFFLPLMVVLGDVIWIHHQYSHPRLCRYVNEECITAIERQLETLTNDLAGLGGAMLEAATPFSSAMLSTSAASAQRLATVQLYGQFIVHVQYVLLHGRWDAFDMLAGPDKGRHDPPDKNQSYINPIRSDLSDWIISPHFVVSASHAIEASDTLSRILKLDPELAYMPYLFGIYLLHGSFMLLFFAHRMPLVADAPNQSVQETCETIIRAHEVCVATLSVEFQRDFRRVLRRTLYDVTHATHNAATPDLSTSPDFSRLERTVSQTDRSTEIVREVLGLYRWSNGRRGLAV